MAIYQPSVRCSDTESKSRTKLRLHGVILAIVAAGVFVDGKAQADAALFGPTGGEVPNSLRPGTRRMFAAFGMGPAVRLDDVPSQLKLEQVFAYHLDDPGTYATVSGPSIGVALGESFGNNVFLFQLGARGSWDFQLFDELGLYLAPITQIGFAVGSATIDSNQSDVEAFLNAMIGAELRFIVENRVLVFWRPVAFDFFLGDAFGWRYDFLFGAGATF